MLQRAVEVLQRAVDQISDPRSQSSSIAALSDYINFTWCYSNATLLYTHKVLMPLDRPAVFTNGLVELQVDQMVGVTCRSTRWWGSRTL